MRLWFRDRVRRGFHDCHRIGQQFPTLRRSAIALLDDAETVTDGGVLSRVFQLAAVHRDDQKIVRRELRERRRLAEAKLSFVRDSTTKSPSGRRTGEAFGSGPPGEAPRVTGHDDWECRLCFLVERLHSGFSKSSTSEDRLNGVLEFRNHKRLL